MHLLCALLQVLETQCTLVVTQFTLSLTVDAYSFEFAEAKKLNLRQKVDLKSLTKALRFVCAPGWTFYLYNP